eukprot:s1694_g4.t1
MYFDDAHITSWKSEGPSAQWAFSQLNTLLGTPFAEDKRQVCASSGTFLGLDYNFATVNTTNSVTFWARERLQEKVCSMLQEAEEQQKFSPAQASKLYGVLNFLENGMFGRVGCGGLQSIKNHQYGRSYRLSPELKQSFELIRTVLACQPKRHFWLTHKSWPRVVAASDAALDVPRAGSGGYLILWGPPATRPREAFVALLPAELYDWFTPGAQKIAQLEMLMIAHALINRADTFRRRRGYWFIDNVASLMCLVRGRSDAADLERISHFIHIVLFALESVLSLWTATGASHRMRSFKLHREEMVVVGEEASLLVLYGISGSCSAYFPRLMKLGQQMCLCPDCRADGGGDGFKLREGEVLLMTPAEGIAVVAVEGPAQVVAMSIWTRAPLLGARL